MATVLALDGDEHSLSILQEILEAFGHVLVPLAHQEEAERAARFQSFDLFLVDIMLEGIDSVDLVRKILDHKPRSLVAAITAYPRAPLAAAVLEAGAHTLMRKPYEIGLILHLLEQPRRDPVPTP